MSSKKSEAYENYRKKKKEQSSPEKGRQKDFEDNERDKDKDKVRDKEKSERSHKSHHSPERQKLSAEAKIKNKSVEDNYNSEHQVILDGDIQSQRPELNKDQSQVPTEQKNIADEQPKKQEAPSKPIIHDNYYYVNSRCRISLKQCKKNVVIAKSKSDDNIPIEPEQGLFELANENYTDFKNYFNSKSNRLFININLENEDMEELNKTLIGILDNINYLHLKMKVLQSDVSIIIIADGNYQLHNDFKKILFKSESVMKDPSPKPTEQINDYMHCFRVVFGDKNYEKTFKQLDLIFAVKENNSGIINSHSYFLNGFCHEYHNKANVDAVFTLLTSAGTTLDHKSIRKCFSTMDAFPEVNAVTGQLEVDIENQEILSFVAGYYFDNKLTHIFEKQVESCCTKVNNLSSDFSFYRLKALTPEFKETYFKNSQFGDVNFPFDKVTRDYNSKLCSDTLFLSQNTVNDIKYIPDALATISTCSEFIVQPIDQQSGPNGQHSGHQVGPTGRKKVTDLASYLHWRKNQYNSKLMATLSLISHFCDVCKTQKEGVRKLDFSILAVYDLVIQAIDYLLLAFNYIFIHVILSQTFYMRPDTTSWLLWIYLILMGIFLILSLSNKNVRHFSTLWFILICLLFIFYVFVIACWCYSMFYLSSNSQGIFNDISNFNISPIIYTNYNSESSLLKSYYIMDKATTIAVAVVTIIGYLIPIIFSVILHPIPTLKPFYYGILSYLFILPTFGGMQQIYALSNIDSYQYSTSHLTHEEEEERESGYRKFKLINILVFIALNGIFIFIFAQTALTITIKINVVAGMVYFFLFVFLFKVLLATIGFSKSMCDRKVRKDKKESLMKNFAEKNIPISAASSIDFANININSASANTNMNIEMQSNIDGNTNLHVNPHGVEDHEAAQQDVKVVSVLDKPDVNKSAKITVDIEGELPNPKLNTKLSAKANLNSNANSTNNVNLNASAAKKGVNNILDKDSFDEGHVDGDINVNIHYNNDNDNEDQDVDEVKSIKSNSRKGANIDINADINFEVKVDDDLNNSGENDKKPPNVYNDNNSDNYESNRSVANTKHQKEELDLEEVELINEDNDLGKVETVKLDFDKKTSSKDNTKDNAKDKSIKSNKSSPTKILNSNSNLNVNINLAGTAKSEKNAYEPKEFDSDLRQDAELPNVYEVQESHEDHKDKDESDNHRAHNDSWDSPSHKPKNIDEVDDNVKMTGQINIKPEFEVKSSVDINAENKKAFKNLKSSWESDDHDNVDHVVDLKASAHFGGGEDVKTDTKSKAKEADDEKERNLFDMGINVNVHKDEHEHEEEDEDVLP